MHEGETSTQVLPGACQFSESGAHGGYHLASEQEELQHSHHLRLVPEEEKLLLQLAVCQIPAISEKLSKTSRIQP